MENIVRWFIILLIVDDAFNGLYNAFRFSWITKEKIKPLEEKVDLLEKQLKNNEGDQK